VTEDPAARDEREHEENERLDRELMELVNELRVALTGVQILFAFLLTVPFTQRFAKVTEFQRHLFFATLLSAAVAVLLLIAPTARHRLLFRQHDKERIVVSSNRYAIAGLVALASAMTGAVMLITDLLFKETMVTWVTAILGSLFVVVWFVGPAVRRLVQKRD
jgi:predicted neutral ceramidase superfamily lipid hydrolase